MTETTSRSTHSPLVRGLIAIVLSRYVVRAIAMIKGIVVARVLGPDLYGTLGLLLVYIGYSAYADLGIFGGLTKLLPPALARGEEDDARAEQRAGLGGVLLTTGLAAVAFAFLAAAKGGAYRGAALSLAFVIVAQQFFKHVTVQLRVRNHFGESALAFALLQAFEFVITLSLVFSLKVNGALIGQGLASLLAAIVLTRRNRLSLAISFRLSRAMRLVAIGFPLVVSTVTFLLMQTVDRLLIERWRGSTELGYYMIGVFCASFVYYIPQTLEFVLFPSFRQKLAELPPGATPPARLIEIPTRALSLVLAPFTGILALGIPLMSVVLPEYTPGIDAARILVIGTFFLSLVTSGTSFLIAADRHWRLMRIQVVAVAVDAALIYLALRNGYGITGAAMATAFSYSLYATAALWLAYRHVGYGAGRTTLMWLRLYAPYAYVLAAVVLIQRWNPLLEHGQWIATTARELVFLAAMIPGAWLWDRATGGIRDVLTVVRSARRP